MVRKQPKEESENTATIKRQVPGKKKRYNTRNQEREAGKDSGEEAGFSQARMTNPVPSSSASQQD